ncbi:MAG: sugar phosphate isomerase/epimerase family protein [Akkermansiaceae bacterium]
MAATSMVSSLSAREDLMPIVTDFGVCTSHKNFEILRAAGYGYVEDSTGRLLKPNKPDDAATDAYLKELKEKQISILACNSFLPGSLKSVGPEARHEAILKYADTAFRRLKLVGGKGIVFGSSKSRNIPKGFDVKKAEAQFVSLLKKMAPLAQNHGVEVWLEPLNKKETNFIQTQVDGAKIIEQVGHPSLGMVCDIYHCARNEEDPASLAKVAKHIRHCHIAEKAKRTAPGMENDDFTPWFRALHQGRYTGTMSVEGRWKNLKEQAVDVRVYMEKQLHQLAVKANK